MLNATDIELVREYARGKSESAFETLVRRHIDLVYSVALRRTGNASQAEEITQAVFTILARKAGRIGPGTVLGGWLYQAARLTSASFIRSEARRRRREQEAFMRSALNESADESAWDQLEPLLEEAMSHLGEKDRNAIVLKYFQDKSAREIAEALDVQEAAAQKRVNRAVEKLRSFFVKRGVAVSAASLAAAISANSVHAAPSALALSVSAVAHGTALSLSTLNLINGGLKLMTWTKAKTTAVAAIAIVLTTGGTLSVVTALHATRAAHYPSIEGAWQGTVETKGARLRLVYHISKQSGRYRATLDSIDQNTKDFPVEKLTYDYPSVRIEQRNIGFSYEGTLDSSVGRISGTWKQLGSSGSMALTRVAAPDVIPQALTEADYAPRNDSEVQGFWSGTLQAGAVPLRLNLKIAEAADGSFHAELDSVDQGASGMPVTVLTYDKPALRFELNSVGGIFEGTVDSGNKTITGTWTQMGNKLPLTFTRSEPDAGQAATDEKYYASKDANDLPGHWKGELNVQDVKLRLAFNFARLEDGAITATLDSLDQRAKDIPATGLQFTAPKVHVEWKAIGGVYDGTLKNGKLTGAWRQGGKSFPLVLTRGGA